MKSLRIISVRCEEPRKEGLLHGICRSISPDGKILSERTYCEGLQDGQCSEYYADAVMYRIQRFQKGQKAGLQETFYKNSALKTVESYKDGLRDGPVTLYWPNGCIKRELNFLADLRHGFDRCWSQEKILLDEGAYEKGRPVGLHRRFAPSGQLIEELDHLDAKRWNFRSWDSAGVLRAEIRWIDEHRYVERCWNDQKKSWEEKNV